MRFKLHNLIFLAMVMGLVVGYALYLVHDPNDPHAAAPPGWYGYVMWLLDLLGPTLFMGALKMIIAPLILASIVAGVTSLPNMRELGAIGWKTLLYYFSTTTVAVAIGLAAVLIIQPGDKPASREIRAKAQAKQDEYRTKYETIAGRPALDARQTPRPEYVAWLRGEKRLAAGQESSRYESKIETITGAEGRKPGEIFTNDIIRPLLMNPFTSLAADPPNALGIIFFALLLGVACTIVGSSAGPVISFFQGLNAVMMRITHWLMQISPVAIGCIVAQLVADTGPGVFTSLGWYCATVIGGILVHICALLAICAVVGGVSPWNLWRGIREAWMIAFSTRSSAATLPVTITNVTQNLNVSPKVANFSLPLGATMNMDGTALYEGVAVIFLIQIFGALDDVPIALTAMTTFLIFITAVLASIGAAAVPNAGLVTMVIVASAVNLPIYYIPLIFAVDAILDMFRTSTNVLGDAIGAVVVNRLERPRLGDTP
ncbi:MAG: dicarboxylate/amino acid:cation symporter [Phycisphaerae bacterium]|jgi:Na+/H+-dicarboxylate symporter